MAKILVTGGSGLLGRNIIPLLEKEHEVIAPFHSDKHYFVMNVTEEKDVRYFLGHPSYSPDIVIHCAAISDVKYSEENPIEIIETNILGTVNVTLECMKRNVKVLLLTLI